MKSCFVFVSLLILSNWAASVNAQIKNMSSESRTAACICTPVTITVQPSNPPSVCAGGGTANLTVLVNGTGPFSFQWRENSVNISDGGVYSGTASAILTITNPSYSLNGKIYRCIITNCSGLSSVITNTTAVLTVHSSVTDLDFDGITDINDFILLIQQYNNTCSNCPEDFNHDSIVNVYDFLQLLGAYNLSCM